MYAFNNLSIIDIIFNDVNEFSSMTSMTSIYIYIHQWHIYIYIYIYTYHYYHPPLIYYLLLVIHTPDIYTYPGYLCTSCGGRHHHYHPPLIYYLLLVIHTPDIYTYPGYLCTSCWGRHHHYGCGCHGSRCSGSPHRIFFWKRWRHRSILTGIRAHFNTGFAYGGIHAVFILCPGHERIKFLLYHYITLHYNVTNVLYTRFFSCTHTSIVYLYIYTCIHVYDFI